MLNVYADMLVMSREVAPIIAAIKKHDPGLADQMRRAAQSVVLNTGEGMHARGRNSGARFQTALGSMRETLSCIEVGAAMAYIEMPAPTLLDRIDKILATLFRLVR